MKIVSSLLFLLVLACGKDTKVLNPNIVDLLDRQYPMFVKTSPSEKQVLLKTRQLDSFDLFICDVPPSGFTKIDRSNFTQLSLTWHPSGNEIIFQEYNPQTRMYDLYKVNINTKKRSLLGLPSSQNAIPPLRWSKKGKYLAYLATNGNIKLYIYDYEEDQIRRVFSDMNVYSNFQWYGDSTLAFIKQPKIPKLTKANIVSNETTEYSLLDEGQLKNFSLQKNKVLFIGRPRGHEYFQLFEQNFRNQITTQLTNSNYNISNCMYYDGGLNFFYNQNENGINKLYCSDSLVNNFILTSPLGKDALEIDFFRNNKLYLKRNELEFAPTLVALDIINLKKSISYYPYNAGYLRLKSPEFIEIDKEDSSPSIPGYLWKADFMDIGKKTIIYVHGGPFLQSKPIWDARIKLLTEYGFNVLVVNYQGSAGYSKKFSDLTNESGQIQDIVASVKWMEKKYSIRSKDVILVGSSFGGKLVLGAIDELDNIGGIVLISGAVNENLRNPEKLRRIRLVGFYGGYDPLTNKAYRFFKGNSLLAPESSNFHLLNEEGHNFHKTSSWAEVYGTIIDVFSNPSTSEQN